MNPIQTDPNPKNDSITEPPEMTPVTRFSHSSQEKKRSDNRRKAARYMQDLHRRNTVGDMLYMVVCFCLRRPQSGGRCARHR